MNGRHGRQTDGKMRVANHCSDNATESTEGKSQYFMHAPACVKSKKLPSVPSGSNEQAENIGRKYGKEAQTRSKMLSLPSVDRIAAIEAEYNCPMKETVEGYFRDGEDIVTAAAILELRPVELRAWCEANGVAWHRFKVRRIPRGAPGRADVRRKIARRQTERCGCGWMRGRRVSSAELSEMCGISQRTIRARIAAGLTAAQAIRIPTYKGNRWGKS